MVDDLTLLSVDELITPQARLTYLVPDTIVAVSDLQATIALTPVLTRDPRTVLERSAGFDIPAWVAVDGKPRAVTGLIVLAAPVASVGTVSQLESHPAPLDVDVRATARWLPEASTFPAPGTSWYPYSETSTSTSTGYTVDDLVLMSVDDVGLLAVDDLIAGVVVVNPVTTMAMHSTTGSVPTRRLKYAYRKGDALVRTPSMAFEHGAYVWCDDIAWSSTDLTMVMVAALDTPRDSWFSVVEAGYADPAALADSLAIRFTSQGDVVLWHGQPLVSTGLSSLYRSAGAGDPRASRPVVIGMNLDVVTNTATLMVLAEHLTVQSVTLPQRVDPTTRVWLGRSPVGSQAMAGMNVLEFAYWSQSFADGDLEFLMNQYDRLYGVSA